MKENYVERELEEASEQFCFNFKLKSNLCNFCFLGPLWPLMSKRHVVLRKRVDFERKKEIRWGRVIDT